jgi:hypothetical protein
MFMFLAVDNARNKRLIDGDIIFIVLAVDYVRNLRPIDGYYHIYAS